MDFAVGKHTLVLERKAKEADVDSRPPSHNFCEVKTNIPKMNCGGGCVNNNVNLIPRKPAEGRCLRKTDLPSPRNGGKCEEADREGQQSPLALSSRSSPLGKEDVQKSLHLSSFYNKVAAEFNAPPMTETLLHTVPRAPLTRSVFMSDPSSYTRVVRLRRQQINDKDIARRIAMLTQGSNGHSYLAIEDGGVRRHMLRDLCERWATIIHVVRFMRIRELAAQAKAMATLKRLLVGVIRRVKAKRRRKERMLKCIAEFVSEMRTPDHKILRANPAFYKWEDLPLHGIIGELMPQAFPSDESIIKPRGFSDIYILNSGTIDVVDAHDRVVGKITQYGTVFGDYSVTTMEPLPVGYKAGKGRVLVWVLQRKSYSQQASRNVNAATVPMNALLVRQYMLTVSHPLSVEALLASSSLWPTPPPQQNKPKSPSPAPAAAAGGMPVLSPSLLRSCGLPRENLEALVQCAKPVSFKARQTIYDYQSTEGFYIVARGIALVTVGSYANNPPRMRRPQFAPTRLSKQLDPYSRDPPAMVSFLLGPWCVVGASKCFLDTSFDGEIAVANGAVDTYFFPLDSVKFILGCYTQPSPTQLMASSLAAISGPFNFAFGTHQRRGSVATNAPLFESAASIVGGRTSRNSVTTATSASQQQKNTFQQRSNNTMHALSARFGGRGGPHHTAVGGGVNSGNASNVPSQPRGEGAGSVLGGFGAGADRSVSSFNHRQSLPTLFSTPIAQFNRNATASKEAVNGLSRRRVSSVGTGDTDHASSTKGGDYEGGCGAQTERFVVPSDVMTLPLLKAMTSTVGLSEPLAGGAEDGHQQSEGEVLATRVSLLIRHNLFYQLQRGHAARLALLPPSTLAESLRCDPLFELLPMDVLLHVCSRAAVPLWFPRDQLVLSDGAEGAGKRSISAPPAIIVIASGMCAAEEANVSKAPLFSILNGMGRGNTVNGAAEARANAPNDVVSDDATLNRQRTSTVSGGGGGRASIRYSLPPPPQTTINTWCQSLPPGTVIGTAAVFCNCSWEYGLNIVSVSPSVEVFRIAADAFQSAIIEAVPNKVERLKLLNTLKEAAMRVVRAEPYCLMD